MVVKKVKQRYTLPEIGQAIAGILIGIVMAVGVIDFFFRELPSILTH